VTTVKPVFFACPFFLTNFATLATSENNRSQIFEISCYFSVLLSSVNKNTKIKTANIMYYIELRKLRSGPPKLSVLQYQLWLGRRKHLVISVDGEIY